MEINNATFSECLGYFALAEPWYTASFEQGFIVTLFT